MEFETKVEESMERLQVTDLEDKLQRLQLIEKSALSVAKVEPDYVLDFAVQKSGSDGRLAATSSNYNIRIYSRVDLANVGSIKGHTDVVSGVTFGKTEPSLLFSSSHDETLRCWDLRVGMNKEVQAFSAPATVSPQLTCLDIDCTDKLLCAGTEEDDDSANILFWDRRKAECLGCYGESHQGDITQVRFNPSDKDRLSTACVGGLVCVFDISQTSEDDALLYTFNAECSVNSIGWYGSRRTEIYCLTSIDTFHVWDTVEGDEQARVNDVKDKLQGAASVDYIVDLLQPECDNMDILVAGTYGGDVRILEVVEDDVKVVHTLGSSGHTDRVRCCDWDAQTTSLVTGGEDSLLCLWSTQTKPSAKVTSKSRAKLKRKGRSSQPYKL
ncbi:WD repeat-containing protein 89-like isoform X2 [Haliotis rufescens]|uniref:WD repeat-containing protein 89-like isoform X2 n=1 Tax=Haliotis rufescens TaxID=6454 RepID=UPI001EB071FE|nr:WD repeat-containing protein 89-like isoform X2 [Haliotis rufescens]